MKNYICINGKKTELTKEQLAEMRKSFGVSGIKLGKVPAGETFKIGDFEFVCLEQKEETTAVVLKGLYRESERFGDNNNYDGSHADKLCNDFLDELAAEIGIENIIPHIVDLTSLEGLDDYGKIERRVSSMTLERNSQYVKILDKYKVDRNYWLATPWSTKAHGDASFVLCVSPPGRLYYFGYGYLNIGVRPFCILDSGIFVSCEG